MRPRTINAGSKRKIWLGQFPYSHTQSSTEVLERVFPAEPSPGREITRAAFQSTRGHEGVNLLGGEFIPDMSGQLVIRVPLENKIDGGFELDRPRALEIMARLVIAGYTRQEGVKRLGSGLLHINSTGWHVSNSRRRDLLKNEVVQLLPLLWPDTDRMSDEGVIDRLSEFEKVWFDKTDGAAVPDLLSALHDPDETVRMFAAEELSGIGSKDAVPDLIEALQKDPAVASAAANALARIGDERAMIPLMDALVAPNQPLSTRRSIVNAFERLGDRSAVPLLLAELEAIDARPQTSKRTRDELIYESGVFSTLDALKDDRAVPTLIQIIEHSDNWFHQARAAATLGEIGDQRAVPPLLQLLQNANARLRIAAANALGEFGDRTVLLALVEAAEIEMDEDAQGAMATALGVIGDASAWDALVGILGRSKKRKEDAARSLGKIDRVRARRLFVEMLTGDDQRLRLAILTAISGTWGDPENMPLLFKTLENESDDTRKHVLLLIGSANTANAVPNLVKIAQNEAENKEVRMAAFGALRWLRSPEAVPGLLPLVDHQDPLIVAEAISTLGEIGDERAVPKLIEKLYDERGAFYIGWYVYTWAEQALSRFKTPQVDEAIREAFRKRNKLDGARNSMTDYTLNLIIPMGTQVVTHVDIKSTNGEVAFVRGAVGVIVKSPVDNTHHYRVRFMDGTEAPLKRGEFSVRKHFTDPQAPSDRLAEFDLYNSVIFRCIVGSRAYGLDDARSDTDLRGIYLPPADLQWSLFGVPEQLENDETQECYWEMQKFITLALKANPNILECLYTPLVEQTSPVADELRDLREIFLSKLIYQTYNGYVMSQFKKMQHDLENHGGIRWKHAMHLIRLLISGVTALREGYIPVRVEEHREQLLAIRREELPWEEVNGWRIALHKEFQAAFEQTRLPERPDYEKANAFLVKARRSAL